MSFYKYRKSHCGDKMVTRPSYLHNGISYTTGKMTSLYWIRTQVAYIECPNIMTITAVTINGNREPMMMSSNGNILCVSGPLWGESTSGRWIPLTKASDAELWCFWDLHLNKRLSKQSRRRWFEMPLHSLWHHCNALFHLPALSLINQLSAWWVVSCKDNISTLAAIHCFF